MNKTFVVCLAISLLFLSGCVSQTWKINNGKTTVKVESGNQTFDQTILINKKTGETWVLHPENSEFFWKKITNK
jgi:hypothetical protein